MNTLPGLLLRWPLRCMVSSFAALAMVGGLSLTARAQIGSGWSPGGETFQSPQTSAGCTIKPIPGGYEFHVPAGHGRAELRGSGADLSTTWLWEGTARIVDWPSGSSSTSIYQLWGPPSGDVIIAMDAGGGTTTNLISPHGTRKLVGNVPVGVPFDFAAGYDPATATEYIYINGAQTGTTILIDPPSSHYDKFGLYVLNSGNGPATLDWTNISNWKGGILPHLLQPPTNLLSMVESNTTVSLSWTAPPSSGITGYNIYNGSTLAGTTSSTSFTVTGLTASTAYIFTATAIYGTIESAHSNSITVTTTGLPLPQPPTNLTVSSLTNSTATVSWVASASPGLTGYNVSINGGVAVKNPVTGTSYMFLNSLTALTNYTVTVTAIDGWGNSSLPASISFTTLNPLGVSPQPPMNLVSTDKTDRTVNLSWMASPSPSVYGYYIYQDGNEVGTTTSTTFTVTGLTANTTYTFTAKAFDLSNDVSPASNPLTVTTSGPPQPPTNLTVSNLTSTSARVSWTASTSPGVRGYFVTGGPGIIFPMIFPSTWETSWAFDSLTPNTVYTIYVSTVGASFSTSQPVSISFTTPPSLPVVLPPTNLMVTNLTSTTATVSWTASTSPGVIGYNVSGGPGLVFPATTPTTPATSYAFTGLTPNTTYTINVSTVAEEVLPPPYALASINFSQPVSISFTTPPSIIELPPAITSPGTASGTVGVPFSYQITATNSPTSYGATGLPVGLSVNASTGLISGTPSAPGTFTVILSATNAAGTANQTLTLTISSDWILAGAADFSGNDLHDNGQSDLIWQNMVSGQRTIWLMNGTTPVSEVFLGTVSTDWRIVGAADFYQDGNSDLIWQNTVTGQCAIWIMNGTTYAHSVDLGSLPLAWQLVGAGKFSGTAQPDLIWQNTKNGQRALWLMNGTSYARAVSLGIVSTDWDIVGAADFLNNGNSDLIWQNTKNGQRALWLMNGTTYARSVNLGMVSTNWNLVGAADFNGDGQPDLIWQDMTSRQYAFWLMNGASYDSSVASTVPLPPGQNFDLSNWKLQEPIGLPGSPINITQPQLATFTDAYFYTDLNDGAMDFWCPENGVKTPNSSFPRSELREVKPGGDWPETGTHTLTATLMVKDTEAHVCVGQIHVGSLGLPASTKPLCELYDYAQDFTHKNGDIYLSLELNPGPPAYTSLPQKRVFITNVPMGQKFDYTIQLSGNTLTLMVHDLSQPSAVTKTFTVDPSFATELFYFKAGDYLQVAGGTSSTVGAHVSFYALNVTHQP